MRLVFAGTPRFAAVCLLRLLQCGHDVVSVLTRPDKPSGRGLHDTESPVKAAAISHGIAVQQPASLRDPEVQNRLAPLRAEAWVVAAYGLILPAPVLALPRLGCLNVHASLLPRWRGAAPIQRALMAGDREIGISIMRMDEGLDTGPVYLRRPVAIDETDTAGSLHDRLAQVGAEAICEVLERLARSTVAPEPQPELGASYAHKLTRDDARIDWTRPAEQVERLLRALDPAPGAFTTCGGDTLKIWAGRIVAGKPGTAPGTVLQAGPQGIEVQCSDASLLISLLQRPGSRRLSAAEFLRGRRLEAGTLLGS
jgi:methionyl-tRNA formyltransferase